MAVEKRKDKNGYVLRRGECYRSDGRYSFAYTDREKHRHVIYAKNIVELREKEKQVLRDRDDGLDVSSASRMTLNDLIDRYLSQKFNLKPTTLAGYVYNYESYIKDGFGKRRICDIKYSDIMKFYYSLMSERKLSPATVEHVHTIIHPSFKLAIREGLVRTNPSDDVMNEIKASDLWVKTKRKALTIPQQKAFVNYLEETIEFKGWYPIMIVLLGTGMRIGECLGLRWEDVDFKNRMISVNHNLTDRPVGRERKIERHIMTPKTEAGNRKIPIVDEVMEAFLLEYQLQKCLGFCEEEIDGYSGFIFATAYHTLYQASAVNNAIHRITDAYNEKEKAEAKAEGREAIILPEFSAHNLRHTFCTRLCENESNLKVIQDIMGHADIQTTMDIYAECTQEKKQEVVANLQGKIIIK